jgi:poly-gamma-glutamate synthesis protein (capsule biosynthesis protein)
MINRKLKTILIVLTAILAAELVFIGVMRNREKNRPIMQTPSTQSTTEAPTKATEAPTENTTEAPTEEVTTAPTAEATEETEPTEPEQNRFVLTFLGDCTLGSTPGDAAAAHSFVKTIGEDYDYPFAHVKQYFEADDFTFANLECVFTDEKLYSESYFAFRGPTAYTQILTGSSVEAVTLANNHTGDFHTKGLTHTKDALNAAHVTYVEKDASAIHVTESGLTIGLYAVNFVLDERDMKAEIQELKDHGAELIIVAFHWGSEGHYRPGAMQVQNAQKAVDAGAHIVYGAHPHVLQKIEEYNGGIIYYSLGNFSFGGNNFPRDMDSAILQQEVIREPDGTIRLGELNIVPVSISSMERQNNFQPIPYEAGTEAYDRTLSKLDGTFTGPNLLVEYD